MRRRKKFISNVKSAYHMKIDSIVFLFVSQFVFAFVGRGGSSLERGGERAEEGELIGALKAVSGDNKYITGSRNSCRLPRFASLPLKDSS